MDKKQFKIINLNDKIAYLLGLKYIGNFNKINFRLLLSLTNKFIKKYVIILVN